jgi:hypothetical protein
MNSDKLKQQFVNARKFGVPILGIETPDMAATIDTCSKALTNGTTPPLFCWDVVTGLRWLNKEGEQVASKLYQNAPNFGAQFQSDTINPTEMCLFALKLSAGSCVFMMNAQSHYDQPSCAQAIWNLRDKFKATKRTLVLLGPTLKMPPELERDVLVFDEPLPDDESLGLIADSLYVLTGQTTKFPKVMRENTVKAARGLSAFGAEQAIALSLTKAGIDTDVLWEHKRKMVEQTKGLRIYQGGEMFDDIGGLDQLKEFGRLLFAGKEPPAAIIWIDEIEKAMAGSSGSVSDSSGTSQDQLGQLLTEMQNNEWAGMILPGPPGCAKSLFAKALGTTHGVPCIQLDLGAMKGSLVGQSEQQIRSAMKVIKAVAGKNAYWVATCNRMDSLPPELRRRFGDGTWFCDLPSENEREAIWKINRKRYKVNEDDKQPNDSMFTGADIRNVCAISYRLKVSLKKASTYITPVAKSDPQSIERLRRLAHRSFLCASKEGLYEHPTFALEEQAKQTTGRTISQV